MPPLTLERRSPSSGGAAHTLSHVAYTLPATLSWEALMQKTKLPGQFVLHAPDDALAPRIAKGTGLIFDVGRDPTPGVGVLVEDKTGRRYVRRYAEAPGGSWQAQALHAAYATLEPERDGAVVLAVMTGRLDGNV